MACCFERVVRELGNKGAEVGEDFFVYGRPGVVDAVDDLGAIGEGDARKGGRDERDVVVVDEVLDFCAAAHDEDDFALVGAVADVALRVGVFVVDLVRDGYVPGLVLAGDVGGVGEAGIALETREVCRIWGK